MSRTFFRPIVVTNIQTLHTFNSNYFPSQSAQTINVFCICLCKCLDGSENLSSCEIQHFQLPRVGHIISDPGSLLSTCSIYRIIHNIYVYIYTHYTYITSIYVCILCFYIICCLPIYIYVSYIIFTYIYYFCITFAKQMKFCAQWSLLICFFTLTRSQMVPPLWNQYFPLTGLGHMIWDAGWSDCEFWLWRTGECSNSPFSFNQNVMDDDKMKNEEADQANEDEMKLIRRKT